MMVTFTITESPHGTEADQAPGEPDWPLGPNIRRPPELLAFPPTLDGATGRGRGSDSPAAPDRGNATGASIEFRNGAPAPIGTIPMLRAPGSPAFD